MTTTPTIDELLTDFTLVPKSKGNLADREACGASLLSIAAGEHFSDRLECAHPLLNDLMIRAFDDDATTPEQLEGLVRAGEHGLLNTWQVPGSVVVAAHARPLDTDADEQPADKRTLAELALDVFGAIAWWKLDQQKPGLDGANLIGANLIGANLDGANLDGANLIRANLIRANLDGANLDGANLDGAILIGANLDGANLDGANLDGANLIHCLAFGSARNITSARGDQYTRLPAGWHIDEQTGLVAADVEVQA